MGLCPQHSALPPTQLRPRFLLDRAPLAVLRLRARVIGTPPARPGHGRRSEPVIRSVSVINATTITPCTSCEESQPSQTPSGRQKSPSVTGWWLYPGVSLRWQEGFNSLLHKYCKHFPPVPSRRLQPSSASRLQYVERCSLSPSSKTVQRANENCDKPNILVKKKQVSCNFFLFVLVSYPDKRNFSF